MLSYNEIKPKKFIVMDGQPYEVLDSNVFRKQQRKPVNQTKLRNLITGKVQEHSFHQSESVHEAEIEKREAAFHFNKGDEWWFYNPEDKGDRFSLPSDLIEGKEEYLKEGTVVTLLYFNDEPIGLELPIKMQFKVKMAPPNVKGNTAQGGTKVVTLETGARVATPLFIETDDIIEINTETGDYVTRVEKA